MIAPFNWASVSHSVDICPIEQTERPNNCYSYRFHVDVSHEDESYIYASPRTLLYTDRDTGKKKRYGFLPYPKAYWKWTVE